jgi:hypothetical protein
MGEGGRACRLLTGTGWGMEGARGFYVRVPIKTLIGTRHPVAHVRNPRSCSDCPGIELLSRNTVCPGTRIQGLPYTPFTVLRLVMVKDLVGAGDLPCRIDHALAVLPFNSTPHAYERWKSSSEHGKARDIPIMDGESVGTNHVIFRASIRNHGVKTILHGFEVIGPGVVLWGGR